MERRSRNRGFTLIEIVATTLILAIVILAVLAAFVAASSLAEGSKNLTQALEDARTVLERIRSDVQTSPDIPAFVANFPETLYEDWVVDQQAIGTEFVNLGEETIDVTYGDLGGDPLGVTVAVTWTERGGRQRTTSLQTQMTRR